MIDLTGVFRLEYTPLSGLARRRTLILRNDPTTEGVNYLLNTAFRGQAQSSGWRLGIISGSGFSAVSADDTLASHPGWTEHTSTSPQRPSWNPTPAGGGLMTGGTTFVISGPSALLKGVFLTSSNTIGGAGILYSTAVDPTGVTTGGGGFLSITYAVALRPRS